METKKQLRAQRNDLLIMITQLENEIEKLRRENDVLTVQAQTSILNEKLNAMRKWEVRDVSGMA